MPGILLQTNEPLFLSIQFQDFSLVFSTKQLNICGSLSSRDDLGLSYARQKLAVLLVGRPRFGICHFCCSPLVKVVTSQHRFQGRENNPYLSIREELEDLWLYLIHHKDLLIYYKLAFQSLRKWHMRRTIPLSKNCMTRQAMQARLGRDVWLVLCQRKTHIMMNSTQKRRRCIRDNFTLSQVLFKTVSNWSSLQEQNGKEFGSVVYFWIGSR